jgi:hypothetical protein
MRAPKIFKLSKNELKLNSYFALVLPARTNIKYFALLSFKKVTFFSILDIVSNPTVKLVSLNPFKCHIILKLVITNVPSCLGLPF